MKSVASLINGGAAAVWKSTPTVIKWPIVIGMVTLSVAELTTDSNHALQSGAIFGGQGAQGQAQMRDPVDTRRAMNAGKPVSGAERMITVQFEKEEAAAQEQQAKTAAAIDTERELRAKETTGENTSTGTLRLYEMEKLKSEAALRAAEAAEKAQIALAANESEQDLLGKLRRGIPLSSVENLKLQEIRRARAEASIKEAEETAAAAQADANKRGAELASRMIRSMTGNGNSGFDTRRLSNDILNGTFLRNAP